MKFLLGVIFCLCLFLTRPINNKIVLPKNVQDTVGDIPVIEHWDDGKLEIIENPNFDSDDEKGGVEIYSLDKSSTATYFIIWDPKEKVWKHY